MIQPYDPRTRHVRRLARPGIPVRHEGVLHVDMAQVEIAARRLWRDRLEGEGYSAVTTWAALWAWLCQEIDNLIEDADERLAGPNGRGWSAFRAALEECRQAEADLIAAGELIDTRPGAIGAPDASEGAS